MKKPSKKMKTPVMTGLAVLGLMALAFGVGAILTELLKTRDSAPAELIGGLWHAEVKNDSVLYFVTKKVMHELQIARYLPWDVVTFRRYTLESRNLKDGTLRARIILGDYYGQEKGSEILGIAQNRLWVWNEQIEVRDLHTLDLLSDSEKIRSSNPSVAEVFPRDPKFFRVSARLDALMVKSLDARYFTVSSTDGTLSWLDDEKTQSEDLDCRLDWTRHQRPDGTVECGRVWYGKAQFLFQSAESAGKGQWETVYSDYLHQVTRDKNIWYGLLSPEERSTLRPSDVTLQRRPYGDVARMLYQVPLRHNSKRKEWELDLGQMQKVTQTRFLRGGLLKRRDVVTKEEYTWRLNDPPGVLILSKPTLEEDSFWQLTRMNFQGTAAWSVSTKLAMLREILPGDRYIVMSGFPDARGSQGTIPLHLVTIRTRDGHTDFSTIESLKAS